MKWLMIMLQQRKLLFESQNNTIGSTVYGQTNQVNYIDGITENLIGFLLREHQIT